MQAFLGILLVAVVVCLGGCKGASVVQPGQCGTAITDVTWVHVQPILATHCVPCHDSAKTAAADRNNANPNYNFDSYGATIASLQDGAAVTDWTLTGDMPPPGNPAGAQGVNLQELCLLNTWVRAGTPNANRDPNPEAGEIGAFDANNRCNTGLAKITWTQAQPVFAEYCTPCHAATVQGAARNGAPDDVNFDSADAASAAVHDDNAICEWTAPDNMPPPENPLHLKNLEDDDVCILDAWAHDLPPPTD
jgi:hypothetical protein